MTLEMTDIVGLCKAVLRLRDQEEAAEQQLREIRLKRTEQEAMLAAAMRQEEITSIAISGKTILVQTFHSYRLPTQSSPQYEEALNWLEQQDGGAELIRRQVPYQSAAAFLRELAESGIELPSFIHHFSQDRITVRGNVT